MRILILSKSWIVLLLNGVKCINVIIKKAGLPFMKAYFSKLYRGTQTEFFLEVSNSLKQGKKEFIVTANPETFMIGNKNPAFDTLLLDSETRIVPDGIGLVKAANMLGIAVQERITGVDLVTFLLEEGNRQHKSIYLYGSKPEVIAAMQEKLKEQYPGVTISGVHDGYSGDSREILNNILAFKPDIVLIALGIPKQELLISQYFPHAEKGIFVGVGGSFDVISGMKKRAPKFWINHNLEWLYRILKEPKRIKRFYQNNVKFIRMVRKMKGSTSDGEG